MPILMPRALRTGQMQSSRTVGAEDVKADVSMLNVERSGVTGDIEAPSKDLAYEEYLKKYEELQAGLQPGYESSSEAYQAKLNKMYDDLKSTYEQDITNRQKALARKRKYGGGGQSSKTMSASLLRKTGGAVVDPDEYYLNEKIAEYNAKLQTLSQVGNEELGNIASAYQTKAEKLAASGKEFETFYNEEGRFKEALNSELTGFGYNFNPDEVVKNALASGGTVSWTPIQQMVKVTKRVAGDDIVVYNGPLSGAPSANDSRGYSLGYTFNKYQVGNDAVFSGDSDWYVQKDTSGKAIKIVQKPSEYTSLWSTPRAGGKNVKSQYFGTEILLEPSGEVDKVIKRDIYDPNWTFSGGQTYYKSPYDMLTVDYDKGKINEVIKKGVYEMNSNTGGSSMSIQKGLFDEAKLTAQDGKLMFKEAYAPYTGNEDWAKSGNSVAKSGSVYKQYQIDYLTGDVKNWFAPQTTVDKSAFYSAVNKKLSDQFASAEYQAKQKENLKGTPYENAINWSLANPYTGAITVSGRTSYVDPWVVKSQLPSTKELGFGNVRMTDAGTWVRYDTDDRGYKQSGEMGMVLYNPTRQKGQEVIQANEFKLGFGYEYSKDALKQGMAPTGLRDNKGNLQMQQISSKELAKNANYKQQYSLVNKLANDYATAKTPAAKLKAQEKYVKERAKLDSFNLQETSNKIDALGWVGSMGAGLNESGPTFTESSSSWQKVGNEFVISNKTTESSFPNWSSDSKEFKRKVTDNTLRDQWDTNAAFLFKDQDKDGTVNAVDCNLTNSCKQSNWILDGRTMNCKKYKSAPIPMRNKGYGLVQKSMSKTKGKDMLSRLKGLF